MKKQQSLLFEISKQGRIAYSLPESDIPALDEQPIPEAFLRESAPRLPEVSEGQLMRHYVGLANRNFGVDTSFYPLGSCTMKYNPKINETIARLPGLAHVHPYQAEATVQGMLSMLYDMQTILGELTGMHSVSLQPAAGAHGEWAGLMMIKAYHEQKGDSGRDTVIVPDSAHGTNPASANVAGYKTVTVRSNDQGLVDIDHLKELVNEKTAALMLTNPNTLGLFESSIIEMADIVHQAGGKLYYDGANLNAILGKVRPGDMGFDVVHLNLHKTFTGPHGGGGPGSGPVGVVKELADYLPKPVLEKGTEGYYWEHDRPLSIGRVRSYYGNIGIVLRAYAYILAMGKDGLNEVSTQAVINANYLKLKLSKWFDVPYPEHCMHEFVVSGKPQKKLGVRVLDIAKRLLDYGYHPPTIYFPLNVEECMMIEPTETESKETLDEFAEALGKIVQEIIETPELVQEAPHTTVIKRLDETRAARKPVLIYEWNEEA
ncbi:aminomethyl-transferring glycine dehydrogenase subunit GcvPB [Aureibacillus halotolerans]|uniref:Probable glycine dehydrogenase (decarboxylating) subunit 2 n=1 Tax=Aureibacillus halotolerans TaxID=1508390 RepID=A0A4R6U7C2_9BACI|nr:aminomethyl-transferring glycine dehydrogenase subunit GcvPB [Aureibacillus halotolerans]TDQ41666.1 glycine dehydrogenase (decarboxylating) beta subunit [Aureibacillus halotolerans]